LEIGSFYHSPRIKQLGFSVFECIQPIFLIFRRISVTNHTVSGLIDFHSIFFFPMEVNEIRNCLVIDILLNIRKSAEWI